MLNHGHRRSYCAQLKVCHAQSCSLNVNRTVMVSQRHRQSRAVIQKLQSQNQSCSTLNHGHGQSCSVKVRHAVMISIFKSKPVIVSQVPYYFFINALYLRK